MPTADDEDAAQQEKRPSRLVFDQRTGRLVIDGLAEVEEPSKVEEEQAECKVGAKEEASEEEASKEEDSDGVDWGPDGQAEEADDKGAKTQKTPEEVKGEDDNEEESQEEEKEEEEETEDDGARTQQKPEEVEEVEDDKEMDEDELDAKQEEEKEEEEETEDDGARTQQKPEEVVEMEDDKETNEDEPDAKQETDASGARPGSEEEESPRSRSSSPAAAQFDGFRQTAEEEWTSRFCNEGSAKGGAQKEESQGKQTGPQNTKELRKEIARRMKETRQRVANEKELVQLQTEASQVRHERSNMALQLAALEESPASQVSY
jgi:hypothetical protein